MFTDPKQFNDIGNLNTWLDIVWSLVVLEKADDKHLASVLSVDFISNLMKLKGRQNLFYMTNNLIINIFYKFMLLITISNLVFFLLTLVRSCLQMKGLFYKI